MVQVEPSTSAITISALDSYSLGGTLYWPEHSAPAGLVLINAATAVPARHYAPFAAALAKRGLAAITWDYRGIGLSRPRTLRGFKASMRDWIDLDAEGVLRWAHDAYPELPLLSIGHSLGGHAIGLCEASQHLAAAALIGTAVAWIGYIPSTPERLRITALLRVVCPTLAVPCGYVPMRLLGVGEDLPTPAFRDWAHWIAQRRYFFDDPTLNAAARFARIRIPLLLAGAEDDAWTPAPAIDLLGSYLTSARCERWRIALTEAATGRVGHTGFFRREHADTLWPRLIAWLLTQLEDRN